MSVGKLLQDAKHLSFRSHHAARNQIVAVSRISAGSTIISTPSFTTVLLASEKGRRCDTCHKISTDQRPLFKCSGCASYWYCDNKCQITQWSHHKHICKSYNSHIASGAFQSLSTHEKQDSILLSHLVTQIISSKSTIATEESSPLAIFLSLLPGPTPDLTTPPICPMDLPVSIESVQRLYSRFENNNFAIHSHLTTFGHGIFPLASRLFNHSCVPNAAAKYILSTAGPVTMNVVALRDIPPDEEICIPYLDPALLQSRHQILEFSYGFKCECSSCECIGRLGFIPQPPKDGNELWTIARMLRNFVGINHITDAGLPSKTLNNLPSSLLCVLHESYMSELSETFSKASHGGQYGLALDSGVTLLALYIVVYPPNFPQIGMHLLELAKISWNAIINSQEMNEDTERQMKERVGVFLSLGRKILEILGPEGDDGGPLEEVQILQRLLDD